MAMVVIGSDRKLVHNSLSFWVITLFLRKLFDE